MSYSRINWENTPSTKTPISAENLNKMDEGIFNAHKQISATRIINSAQGKTILTTDSANAPLVNLKAKGDTWQKQYEGKNRYSGGDVSGVRSVSVAIEPIQAGTYTVSANVSSTDTDSTERRMLFYADDTLVTLAILTNGNRVSHNKVNIASEVNKIVFYGSSQYALAEGDTFSFKDIQVEPGEVATEYEPYVGNKPSPNMEYPQPIENLENVEVKVLKSNLFDVDKALETGTNVELGGKTYFKFENGQTYTMSFEAKKISNNIWFCATSDTWESGKLSESIMRFSSIERLTKTFTIPNDGLEYYLCTCAGGVPTRQQFENMFNGTTSENLQIQLGTVATEYEPYTEQTLTLTLPVSFTKWDKLVKRDDVWGVSVYHVRLVVDASSDIMKWNEFYIPYLLPHEMLYREGFCNGLKVGTNVESDARVWLGAKNDFVYFPSNQFWDASLADKGLANFKAYVAEHPLEILTYADTEQDFIPLSDEDQEKIKSVLMNYPTTTILSNAELEVEYVADTKEHIKQNYIPKNEFEDLKNQVAEIQAQLVNA